jgi:hypothetical protein
MKDKKKKVNYSTSNEGIIVHKYKSCLDIFIYIGSNCQYPPNDPCLAVTCSAASQCNAVGVCLNGNCTTPLLPDDRPCNDTLPPFTGDVCIAGLCTNRCISVTCPPTDQCHHIGTCYNGLCSVQPINLDGTPCNDSLSDTAGDVCLAGVCQGIAVLPSTLSICANVYFPNSLILGRFVVLVASDSLFFFSPCNFSCSLYYFCLSTFIVVQG